MKKLEFVKMPKAKKTSKKAVKKKNPVLEALKKPFKLPFKFLKWW